MTLMTEESCYIGPAKLRDVSAKIDELTRWLADNAPHCSSEQKHLDEDTVERAYWHYGYICALKDVLALADRALPE
jgi:hypothetical protein